MNKTYLLTAWFFLFTFGISQAQNDSKKDFYDTNSIKEFRIKFEQKDWMELMDSLRLTGDGMLIGDLTLDGKKLSDVGIRYRGTRSFKTGSKRNAYTIKLNHINKEQNIDGYKSLKLSNALRDPSMVREVLSYEIARKYMPAPKANYARLYINNEYYGLFVNIESVNKKFLEENFGSKDNTFFKCSPHIDDMDDPAKGCKNKIFSSLQYETEIDCYKPNYELKSDDEKQGWKDLQELTRSLTLEPKKISEVLNVDRALWMLAFNNVLVNLSSYSGQQSQNYYLYKDDEGKFNPIIWDLNLSFGSFKNTGIGSDLNLKKLQTLDPLLHVNNDSKPLISALLKNPQYQKLYLSHMRTILYDNFVNGEYEKRAKTLQRLIQVPFINDQNKFYTTNQFNSSLRSTTGKRSKIPGLVELMNKRARYLKKNSKLTPIPPEVVDVNVISREKLAAKDIKTFEIIAQVEKRPKNVKVYYRYNSESPYRSKFMKDDGKNNDGKAGDGLFGVSIKPKEGQETLEYYIMAETVYSIEFSPTNYMFAPYTADLKELNQ